MSSATRTVTIQATRVIVIAPIVADAPVVEAVVADAPVRTRC